MPIPTPPRRFSPDVFTRETFHAYARANSRADLMDAMRSQAEAYFGCKVELRDATAQPGPSGGTTFAFQGASRWVARAGGAS